MKLLIPLGPADVHSVLLVFFVWLDWAQELMARNRSDRNGRQTSIAKAALEALAAMDGVDSSRIAAIGYCYGNNVQPLLSDTCSCNG